MVGKYTVRPHGWYGKLFSPHLKSRQFFRFGVLRIGTRAALQVKPNPSFRQGNDPALKE